MAIDPSIPLGAGGGSAGGIANAFLAGRDNARANVLNEQQVQAQAAEAQAKARSAKLGQLASMAFRVSREPIQTRGALLMQAKAAAAQLYGNDPEVMRLIEGVTPENVAGYASALVGIKEQLDAGKTDADIANIYNTMSNRDMTSRAQAGASNASASSSYASAANSYDNIRSRRETDAATGYGQVPEGYLMNGGTAAAIPGLPPPTTSPTGEYVPPPGPWNEVAPPTRFMTDPKAKDRFYNTSASSWTNRAEENADAVRNAQEQVRIADEFMANNQNLGTGGAFRWLPGSQTLYTALDSDAANMDRINAQLTPTMRTPGSGVTTDFDARMFQKSTLGLSNPREVNEAIAAGIKGKAQTIQDRATFEEWYYNNAGHLNGAEQAWQSYLDDNPIFDPQSPETPRLNQNRQDWRSYFNGRYSGGGRPQAPASGGGIMANGQVPVRINGDAEWEALAPGTPFVGPDNQVRIK